MPYVSCKVKILEDIDADVEHFAGMIGVMVNIDNIDDYPYRIKFNDGTEIEFALMNL